NPATQCAIHPQYLRELHLVLPQYGEYLLMSVFLADEIVTFSGRPFSNRYTNIGGAIAIEINNAMNDYRAIACRSSIHLCPFDQFARRLTDEAGQFWPVEVF